MFALRNAALRAMPMLAMRTALPRVIVTPSFVARAGSVSAVRAFSNSPLTWSKIDKNLITAIENEIKHEEEQGDEVPDYITEYMKSSPFEIINKVGSDEVIMTRKFNNEEIKIVFSVSDINMADDEDELDMEDDLEDNGQGKESLSASGEDEEDDMESLTFPVRCLITISKPNAGSISIDAVAQDGAFIVESISNIKDSTLATASTAEADWEKRGLYSGPPFAELDENLQVEFEKFLDERQIDNELANFVPNYVFYKDQVEYTHWLKDLKAFVAAK
ncbi:Mitochondrial acidic protein mam33 [Linnemannia zychae]|nr:Mitochondrial acidic protein mam33 [Linnemannia zychae]